MVDYPRIGIAFSGGANPSQIVDFVRLAESLGYESAWVAEGHGGDQFAVLAACAARTSRILLGTSITSVFVRTAPTIAMAALTVDDLSAGRFILGVGSSHKVQVEGEHGLPYTKPLTRVRETVALIRRLAEDGRVRFHGETVRIENFDLWFTPRRRAFPIYVSAVFAKMAALCGEIADGVILTRSTLATAAAIRSHLAEGALRAGRRPSEVTVTSLLPTAVGESRQEALAALRPGLAFYAGFFPRYSRLIAEHGFAAEAAAIAAAWANGDRDAAERAVSDALIDATSIAGTATQCRERVEEYRRSGIDLPILSPFARGPGAEEKFEAVIRACAPSRVEPRARPAG
jgi:alkanesulfonate monooxygenase SsuD/methylene tetrahydromethanopterin reductase-like flavin-dependent oxidoreductase (luciferase family)